jgi:Holliday junction resolvase
MESENIVEEIKGKVERHFEYKVRDYLKSIGCFVTRSTVSKFPDLIAIKPTEAITLKDGRKIGYTVLPAWFIECKTRKYLNKKEKKQLREFCKKYGIKAFIAYPKYSVYSNKKDNIVLEEVENANGGL